MKLARRFVISKMNVSEHAICSCNIHLIFFIFARSISCSMFYFHVLTLLNFEFWISDRSKPHLESALYNRGNSNHSCSLSFSLVSRISPPEKNSRLEFLIFGEFLRIFLYFLHKYFYDQILVVMMVESGPVTLYT